MRHSVQRVLLFPVNGYVNRLQALASAAILADQLDARLQVCWPPFELVPGPASDTLGADFVANHVVTADQALGDHGVTIDGVPLYVSIDRPRGMVFLRGHDRGEQPLMGEVSALLQDDSQPATLVIVAGGSFYLDPLGRPEPLWREAFLSAKRDVYRSLPLVAAAENAAASAVAEHGADFIGLHLRYSDRAHQAPTERAIRRALADQSQATGLARVFVASDTPRARERWFEILRGMGLEPWAITHQAWDRREAGSAAPALADWRVLGRSRRLVYFAESSFAVEAAVASGTWAESTALAVSRPRALAYRGIVTARAALTYPSRHWTAR